MTPNMDILGADDCAELARRIQGGDRTAEARFARLYCDCVFALALARTRKRDAARQLMDDVLMAVILALRRGSVRDGSHLGGFVHGTAINTINGFFRRRRHQRRMLSLDAGLAIPDGHDDSEAGDRLRAVQDAMATLDPRDRQILQLSLAEGLRPGAIAVRLGLSSVAVRQRKCRALRALVMSVSDGASGTKSRGTMRR